MVMIVILFLNHNNKLKYFTFSCPSVPLTINMPYPLLAITSTSKFGTWIKLIYM